jgi:hypothetical protein
MVRRLEDERLCEAVKCWDAQASVRFAQGLRAKCLQKLRLQGLRIVRVRPDTAEIPQFKSKITKVAFWSRKNFSTMLNIEVENYFRAQSDAKAERNDAAGRSAGDHVETLADRSIAQVAVFKFGQNRGRENPANATAVYRQYSKLFAFGPRQLVAETLQSSLRPSQVF